MFNEERETQILNILQENNYYATVEYIAQCIHISPSSVRRDLNKLEQKGIVKRSYGGVSLLRGDRSIVPFAMRTHRNIDLKISIARKAVSLIKEGDVIFIDGSSTAYFLSEYLSGFEKLKVITNGIDALTSLTKYRVDVYSTGGMLSPPNRAVLVGNFAQEMINSVHADIVFFSSQTIDADGVIYDCYEEENRIRQLMMKNSSRKVFLCDSTKLSQQSTFKLCNVNDVDDIICDKPLDDYFNVPVKARFH